ncbi:hypothetical protein M3O96_01120 [Aquiflexum sp. TKW24L]|uniref:hypothetical protein n=1 Tax=Aquiflexum sp. TKW24L TaxID=2942212 RepID=UPI0020C0E2CF|nr:hypothetical protein [Aquiflexum sp. TKW24L]MCL6257668.1 hypothetical protein [Aquiflexum sp. TKW24L]
MKRILTTFKEKWPEYILEILVITIGILGAFALNNWNEQNKAKSLEKEYISRLIEDLTKNKAHIRQEKINAELRLKVSLNVYDIITSEQPVFEDTSRFVVGIQLIGRTNRPRIHDATFEDLISSGNASIIQDRELFNEIRTFYGEIPNEWFDEYIDRLWKGYLPLGIDAINLDMLLEILDQESEEGLDANKINEINLKVSDKEFEQILGKILNSKEFEYETKNIARSHRVHINYLQRILRREEELTQKLSDYLNTL